MIFNSYVFVLFFVVFFALYWLVFNKSLRLQNLLILAGSYFFYAWADWRLLSYLVAASAVNYFLGIYIEKTSNLKKRNLLLWLGMIQGVGGLFYFKYFNFFIISFKQAFASINIDLNIHTLNIIAPIGISYFTFKTLSYLLDVDKGKMKASHDLVIFFVYVAFFPSLLSGPIDKAKMFIPQLETKRVFDYSRAVDGMRQILWGLFKKLVVANNCAPVTSQIFETYQTQPASAMVYGGVLYTFQLYADFSGYTDMAIGFARLIGFNITKNFDFPLFAQNIAEFWRKWHISLTAWLTEYVFTPLSIAFRDLGKFGIILAIFVNFAIIGIWHGANWTYLVFGILHGLYFLPLILSGNMNKKKKIAKGKLFPSFKEALNILLTFILVTVTFIFFRAESVVQAFQHLDRMFGISIFDKFNFKPIAASMVLVMAVVEWLGRDQNYAIEHTFSKWPKIMRWAAYFVITMLIFLFASKGEQFIYLQF
jgi:D-alanyl-lipoteichoic acid acyltransferase DltB (MBOAT superfamily)